MTNPKPSPEKIVLRREDIPLNTSPFGGQRGGLMGRVGAMLGLTKLGCMLQVVGPNDGSLPFHVHHVSDEMMVVLEGQGEYRWGDERIAVGPGDMIGAPAGTRAHQLLNTGDTDLVFLSFSSNHEADIVDYPDSGKVHYKAGPAGGAPDSVSVRVIGRVTRADYWDGEPE